MALSININVNNSDISIKNSKTGAKKNIKSISAGNLNDMTDREFNISQKRKVARKQAMKLISDAWDKDNKAAQGIKDMESEKADIANINADLKSKLKDIDKSQKDLQELYGVHSESQEQKDLELLKKYQDNRNGVSNDKFSKEEIDRLKELQNEPLTEYQKKALMINSSKDAIRSQIDQNDLKAMNKTMSINNAKLEQLKSQDMLKAGDAADSIIEAADKDIFGMLVNEGKQNIDDNMKEQQEEAKKAEEEKEKKQEQIDEAKKKRQEEKELLENEQQADKLELDKSIDLLNDNKDDKNGRLDLRAVMNGNTECDIEVQLASNDNIAERFIYYWAKMYAANLKIGDTYSDLRKTISIIILDDVFKLTKNLEKPQTTWKIRENEELHLILTDYFEIIIIELPKVVKAYHKTPNDEVLQWMLFLDNPEKEEVTRIMEENKDIKEAKEELERISQDDILRRKALNRTLEIADKLQLKKEAEEALEKGKNIGLKEKTNEVVIKLKEMNLPIEQIAKAVELNEEEVKAFLNEKK